MMESRHSKPELYDAVGLTVNGKGDIIFVDKGSNRVRSIDHRSGIISTVAGVCRYGYDGDDKPAVREQCFMRRKLWWLISRTISTSPTR